MNNVKDGYKIVMRDCLGDNYSHCSGDGEVRYKVGEWTKPIKKRGPLAVFADKENATMFLKDFGIRDSILYECKYVPSKRKSMWCFVDSCKIVLKKLPEGTVLANRIMITEEILQGKIK
jgi:hypothetical protein